MSGRGGEAAPLYVRVLRLKRIRPGGVMCFLLFEGVVALAILLSLAELVNWWSVLILPATVAGLVKINDVVAEAFARSDVTRRLTTRKRPGVARGVAKVPVARRRREAVIDDATRAQPRSARRRATNQRRFAPASGSRPAEPPKKPW